MTKLRTLTVLIALIALLAAGCGGDDDDTSAADTGSDPAPAESSDDGDEPASSDGDDAPAEEPADDSAEEPAAPSGGAGGGSMVLGDETINFDSARCFLQEQDAAAGGGKILFVAQAFGVNAAGDEVSIDVSRYDEDSQFYGDDVLLTVGDPFAESLSYFASGEVGLVTVDGNTVSAATLEWTNDSDLSTTPGSMQINC